MPTQRPIIHQIPACPFSQRIAILLELKGLKDAVEFHIVDITKPRDPQLLAKTRGTTALPVLETAEGQIVKESLVILRYIEEAFPDPRISSTDPYLGAVENMLVAQEGPFTAAGYSFVMNRDPARRDAMRAEMVAQYTLLDDFLRWQAPDRTFLFDAFGWAETVFTPMFVRFHFLEYYEGFEIPADLTRVRRWHEACLAHPAAQQISREEVVKVYYDYAMGAGNGALPEGRARSSFVFEPNWADRPWPPRDKWRPATDAELGLA